MPTRGYPQLFAGMVMHWNGVIPRTLKHQSHSIEWRMAEAHGAKCEVDFIPDRVTHLIYRPGYERSEKVRAAITRLGIRCMPITWVLDSLLQSRALHESLYRLSEVPTQALPTGSGAMLQHYHHPYFAAHYSTFSIPGLDCGGPEGASTRSKMVGSSAAASREDDRLDLPQLRAIPTVERRVAAQAWPTTVGSTDLFLGASMFFASAPASDDEGQARERAIIAHGARVVRDLGDATHVIYNVDDKKSDAMQQAVVLRDDRTAQGDESLVLATEAWLLDCLFLNEAVPPAAMYAPSDKLLSTLRKKAARAAMSTGSKHVDPMA
jgi:hypothetical protein